MCRERSSYNPPAVSTPLTTGWRCGSGFELDTVRQRLQLDSPPSLKDRGSAEQRDLQEFLTGNHLTAQERRVAVWTCRTERLFLTRRCVTVNPPT